MRLVADTTKLREIRQSLYYEVNNNEPGSEISLYRIAESLLALVDALIEEREPD